MTNAFYNHGGYPANQSPASSSALRAELDLITAGFDKLPSLTANYLIRVNAGGTALESVTVPTAIGYTPLNAASNLSDLANAATARTNLGLGDAALVTLGSSYRFVTDAEKATWNAKQAALGYTPLNAASNLSDVGSAATSRANLGLAIGTNIQAWDADLDGIAALAGANGLLRKSSGTWGLDTATYLTSVSYPVTSVAGRTGDVTLTKADVSLSLVENTALSSWAGTASITTVGTIGAGTWNATAIADSKIASALTGKTYNGLTLTAAATGFTLAGGTTSKTLTVSNTITFTATDGSTLAIGAGGTLGSAAFTASTAYATSTQGTTADNALPKAGGTMSGAIAMGNNGITGAKTVVFNSTVANSGSTTATYTTDFSTGQKQKLTLTGTITATLAFSFPGAGHYQLHLLPASTVTLAWPTIGSSWQWLNSTTAPTVNTGTYGGVVNIYYDGTIAIASYSKVGAA